jgi:hypothetical protein
MSKLVEPLYAALREHDALQEYDLVEAPRPPADPAALAKVAAALALPPDAIALLAAADGWRGFMPGWELLGVGALEAAQADAASAFDDCETDEEVAGAALVIARSENDAGMLFYDRRTRQPDGRMQLVEWLYEDRQRYTGLEELFGELLAAARAGIADEQAARAELEAEWTEAWRVREAAALREALRQRLATAELPPAPSLARLAALSAASRDDVATWGDGSAAASVLPTDLDTEDAKVCLTLFLHLRGAPSPDEVRRVVAAFCGHFPEAGFPSVARFSWYEARRASLTSPARRSVGASDPSVGSIVGPIVGPIVDPVLDEAIGHPARGGSLGLSVVLASEDGPLPTRFARSLAVTSPTLELHVPGPLARCQSASCLELRLPLGTSPATLRALALELSSILPAIYGYAGYGAVARGVSGVTQVYEWSRRLLCLDVRDARLELAALRDSVKNAAWLTLLGEPLVAALRERFGPTALDFSGHDVDVTPTSHGVLLTAGALSLGDVQGAFPRAVAEVDRRISPLRLRGFSNQELHSLGGVRFFATYTTYDGPFAEGFATRDWLERWIAPERHLGPTPRQQGEALLAAFDAAAHTAGVAAWQARRDRSSFNDLVQLLVSTAHGHETRDEAVAALEWAGRFAMRAQGRVLTALFYGLLLRGDLERARPYLSLVPEAAARYPRLLHNAACVAARLGDRAGALAFVRSAKAAGYDAFSSMQTDSDLTSLQGDPEFDALFA